jgi:hypothetical protein
MNEQMNKLKSFHFSSMVKVLTTQAFHSVHSQDRFIVRMSPLKISSLFLREAEILLA